MNQFIDRITTMRNALQEGERLARRTQYRLTAKLAALLAGALIATATAARLIELDREWWLITAGVVLAAVWGRAASRTADELATARNLRDGLGHAAECLPDEELLDFLSPLIDEPPDLTQAPATAQESKPTT